MLAHAERRDDPRDRRQRAVRRRVEELRVRPDVLELLRHLDGLEARERVHDGVRALLRRLAARGPDAAVLADVVRPADAVVVQQPGDVGPDVGSRRPVGRHPEPAAVGRVESRELLVRTALHGVEVVARRGPCRHQIQVRGQRPRIARREHVVLQREPLRVRPVVRDLMRVVVAHHIGRSVRAGDRLIAPRPRRVEAARVADRAERHDRAVHLPLVDRDPRGALVVRTPAVEDVLCRDTGGGTVGPSDRGCDVPSGMPSAPGNVPK